MRRTKSNEEDFIVGKIYYRSDAIDNDGFLTFNLDEIDLERENEYDKTIDVTSHKVLIDAKTIGDTSFTIIPLTGFGNLKANNFATSEHGCELIEGEFMYGTYTHLGLVLNALTGEDIAPSITWLYKKGPKGVRFTNVPAGEEEEYEDFPLSFTCDDYIIDPKSLSL